MIDEDRPLEEAPGEQRLPKGEDFSGRDRMAWNVLASWGAHAVFIIAGFVLPRTIDRRLGQSVLGIWDFSWSVVSYFNLASIGLGSSVNRYVAQYRTNGDHQGLNRAISSINTLQLAATTLLVAMLWPLNYLVRHLLETRSPEAVSDACFVVTCLGLGLAIQLAFDAYRGVLTGCHRWDLHNLINSGCYAATVVGMLVALAAGGSIRSLAIAHLTGTAFAEALRVAVVRRVCPELQVRHFFVDWKHVKSMVTFGGKVVIGSIAKLLIFQVTSVLIGARMGLAALALFSRPLALINHINTFAEKFAFVLAPAASSLQTSGNHREVTKMFLDSSRYCVFFSLPPLLLLVFLGQSVMTAWMGPEYHLAALVAVLAFGQVTRIAHAPIYHVMVGLDRHARPVLFHLYTAIITMALSLMVVGRYGTGLVAAAIILCLPQAVLHGIVMPAYACRILGIPLKDFVAGVWFKPLVVAVPFSLCLITARAVFPDRPWPAILLGGLSGGAIVVLSVWRGMLSPRVAALLKQGVGRVADRIRAGGRSS
jgi:O-antigen/teichoic acid export membrane protein